MLVDFIYSGKLYLSVKNIDAYLKISNTFESIPIIEKTMLKFLGQSATDDNLIEILNLAEKYDQMNLRDEILGKITNDVEKFHGEILKMNLANFSELLSRDDLNVENETQVVALLKDWISAQVIFGKKYLSSTLYTFLRVTLELKFTDRLTDKLQQVRVHKVSFFFRVREVGVYKVHLFFILTWSHFFEQARICFFCGNPSLKGLAFF